MGGRCARLPAEIRPQAKKKSNPCSDVRLNGRKSAEAIVPSVHERRERAEHQEVLENVKNSIDMRRKQTTGRERTGCPAGEGVEHWEQAGALSMPAASSGGRDGTSRDSEGLLERMLERGNMQRALKRVKANKGSHGVDGMKVDELQQYLFGPFGEWPNTRQSLVEGSYEPQPVRRVEIPKPDGGKRQLGIPTVLDRLIQQALAQVLTPVFDSGFSESSYGFRPGRSAHQAVIKGRDYIQAGYGWVVDMDIEKFFDRVNHDKLMSLVTRKVEDKRVLSLIRKYLESGIMLNGIEVRNELGTPQGGPLSPLLANIMLDELDKELEKRGHKFCRYADDCDIFVRSRKSGERVMKSISEYLLKVLKLKVNPEKSAVDRPAKRKYLGFSFYTLKGKVGIRVHEKSVKRYKEKVRELTSRTNAMSMEERITRLNQLSRGWGNYFGIANAKGLRQKLDEWTRRRLRMCIWKQWKRIRTRLNNLVKLGIDREKAWQYANTKKGYWHVANSPILSRTLSNRYFKSLGLIGLSEVFG
jgi:group II intron reverse transcriptase/maturase